MSERPDLVVLGGGSGGLAAAKRAADLGARVVVVEPRDLGGTCVNRGCVLKKLMWQTARHWAKRQGLAAATDSDVGMLDFSALAAQIGDHITSLRDEFETDLEDRGITLIRDAGRIDDEGRVQVGDTCLAADRVLIATGPKPVVPDIPGAAHMVTSDDVFGWQDLPRSLVILGGGYIGAELASIFSVFGVDVTIVQAGPRLLEGFDAEAVARVTETMAERGVKMVFDTEPTEILNADVRLRVALPGQAPLTADRVICAIGRAPNVGALGLDAETFERAESGALCVDEDFQTSRAGLYAIGDVADRLPLTPVATRDGETFADRAFGAGAERLDLSLVSTAAFTLPAVAQVGDLVCEDGGQATGALKNPVLAPVVEPDSYHRMCFAKDRLVGAVLVGSETPEMIAPFAALVAAGNSARALSDATAIHPSFAEEIIGR